MIRQTQFLWAVQILMFLNASPFAFAEAVPEPEPKTDLKGESPTESPAGRVGRIHMEDGSILVGEVEETVIPIETAYGLLRVPLEEICEIRTGLVSQRNAALSFEKLLKDLGSDDFKDREIAERKLVATGLFYRLLLERSLGDADSEQRMRIKKVLEEIQELVDEDEPVTALTQDDEIETSRFTMAGRIKPSSIHVKTAYGRIEVKVACLARAIWSNIVEFKQDVVLDGNIHMAHKSFNGTRMRLEKGDVVSIVAEGSISMTPWGSEKVCGPDGGSPYGWYKSGEIMGGALVARIGDSGDIFKVGSKLKFTAKKSGVLKFAIGAPERQQDNSYPGTYKVKVHVKRGE